MSEGKEDEEPVEGNDDPIFDQEFKVTLREKIFCERYPVLMNKGRAAQEAGYSPNNIAAASVTGHRLLKKANVIAYLAHVQKDIAALVGVSAARNLEELRKIAYSSIAHLHDTWIERREFELLTDDEKACIESIDTKIEKRTIKVEGHPETDIETHYVKVKLYPKLPALDMMNKMLGYNAAEKIEVKEVLTPEERQAKLRLIEAKIEAERKK